MSNCITRVEGGKCWCLAILLAAAASLNTASQESGAVRLEVMRAQVKQYERVDFRIAFQAAFTNAFEPEDVAVDLVVSKGGLEIAKVPGFFYQDYQQKRVSRGGQLRDWYYPNGAPQWRARFAPAAVGEYQVCAEVRSGGKLNRSLSARFSCRQGTNPGFVRISEKDPRFLMFDDATPFFPVGQNLAFIGDQQHVSLFKAREILEKLNQHGANYLRVWTCCEDWAMAIEARKSAWGRSWNWNPPFVLQDGKKRLRLAVGRPVRVEPSHAVGLRPSTAYRVSIEASIPDGATLKLEMNPGPGTKVFAPRPGETQGLCQAEFQTGPEEHWLQSCTLSAGGADVTMGSISLREAAGGPELLWEAEMNRPIPGFYNPLDTFLLDQLVDAAESNHIYLQLCMLTRDLYMDRLKEPGSAEYGRAVKDAKRFFRHAIGRWGYSTSVAAWEYWNEMNPGLPTDVFYNELGTFFEKSDPYRHLRTTSTWGPSEKDCRNPKLDLADVHFYLRPADKGRLEDEVHAVLERTAWLRQQAPNKPAHLGEFGLADDKWALTERMKQSPELADVHNGLWASALSGASGTALFWWWERLDQRNAYGIYQPLVRFIADVPWTSGQIQPVSIQPSDSRVRAIGLRNADHVWLWCFNKAAAWSRVAEGQEPDELRGVALVLKNLRQPTTLQWWETRESRLLETVTAVPENGELRVVAPAFRRDIALKLVPTGQKNP